MSNRAILKRSYYDIRVILDSPVNIGNGVSGDTDSDVMRNSKGECFIPGTSIAGAFRNYLGDEKKQKSALGYSDGQDGQMSQVYFSDLYFDKDSVKVSVRDRVQLTADKNVSNKFDLEVIEPGARGCIRLEALLRQDCEDPEKAIEDSILALADGDIRFGANKNRGFGRIKVESVRKSEFAKADRERWVRYLEGDAEAGGEAISFEEWSQGKTREKVRFNKVRIPLSLTGGISIRRYSAQPGKADFEHITSNGKPIIPGTSWNGAVRADAKRILGDLGLKQSEIDCFIDNWFGKVKEKRSADTDDSWQSKIVFSESVITGAKMLPMTRNNINRFTGGTKDGALYTELSCVGGETVLEYMIEDEEKLLPLRGMMQLIVRDICNGLVPVGGQTAVGRGIFAGEADQADEDEAGLKALYEEVRRLKNDAQKS